MGIFAGNGLRNYKQIPEKGRFSVVKVMNRWPELFTFEY
jgi:hypothetical protein